MKNNMVKETKSELKKVIWPSRKDVINGTAVVAVMVVIVGIIILAFDFVSSALVKKIISRDDFVVTDIDHTGHDHEHEEGNVERNAIIWSGQFYDGKDYTQVRSLHEVIKKLELISEENKDQAYKVAIFVHNLSYEFQFIKDFFHFLIRFVMQKGVI